MATQDLQRLVAAQVALGASTAELAERFNYTPRGMRKLVSSPAVQALVAEQRAALAEQIEGYRAAMVDLGRKAIENVRRAIEDPRHPRNVETSRWLLDRITGRREAAQVDLQLNVLTAEAAGLLRDSFDRLADLRASPTVPIESDHHLVRAD